MQTFGRYCLEASGRTPQTNTSLVFVFIHLSDFQCELSVRGRHQITLALFFQGFQSREEVNAGYRRDRERHAFFFSLVRILSEVVAEE